MLCFNYSITMNLSQTGCNDEVVVAKKDNNNNPRFIYFSSKNAAQARLQC